MASPEFQKQLIDALPRLSGVAFHLTRNRSAAEDLLQDTAMKALSASETFMPGTNFIAWTRRILYNRFISGMRVKRECYLDEIPEVAVAPSQQDTADVREMTELFHRLPTEQKEAFDAIVFQEKSYDEVSDAMGVAVGTLKSRVHRARLQLRAGTVTETRRAV